MSIPTVDPDSRSDEQAFAAASSTRSTARQVVYWLMLTSLLIAVLAMGAWWIASAIPTTASTMCIFMFATVGLWVTIYQLFVLGIKRMVRDRIAPRPTDRG